MRCRAEVPWQSKHISKHGACQPIPRMRRCIHDGTGLVWNRNRTRRPRRHAGCLTAIWARESLCSPDSGRLHRPVGGGGARRGILESVVDRIGYYCCGGRPRRSSLVVASCGSGPIVAKHQKEERTARKPSSLERVLIVRPGATDYPSRANRLWVWKFDCARTEIPA